ncbi:MAG: hypothetical protein MUE51_13405 [Thermoleophilia bacterium]|nr:hypothetical protein [Thermoleophilia bacterium]
MATTPLPAAPARGPHPLTLGTGLAAGGVVLGAFMPWAGLMGGRATVAGIDGDGLITLVLGLTGLVVLIGAGAGRAATVVQVVLAATAGAIGILDLVDLERVAATEVEVAASAPGLWVTVAGGLAWLATALAALVVGRRA